MGVVLLYDVGYFWNRLQSSHDGFTVSHAPLALQQSMAYSDAAISTLQLSRVSSIIMLIAYAAYFFFQLRTQTIV